MSTSESIILKMLSDVKKYNNDQYRDLTYYVNLRLDKSVENYYKQLLGSKNFLATFNELSVAKKLINEK